MTKTEEFLKLVKENPDLPIIPFVNSEVCADDSYAYWIGSFGRSEVDEYTLFNDRVIFKGDGDAEEILSDYYCDEPEYENVSDEEFSKAMEKKVEELEWIKAIIVYINEPD